MVSRLLLPMLLVTGALALACGPRSHTEASSHATSARVATEHREAAERAAARARRMKKDGVVIPSLDVTATASDVRFSLALENAGSRTVEMHFADGQTHDIVVLDSIGREVWRWGKDRIFTQAFKNKMLAGGDTLRVEESWTPTQLHGTYTAVAVLRSTNYPVEQRVAFTLP